MKRFVTLLFLLAAFSIATAQVVVTVPEFPTENDSIVVIFDATEGDGGLQGFNGDVYAHTGVITNLSTGLSDWKYVKTPWPNGSNNNLANTPANKLTRISPDLYQLVIGFPREYYGLPNPAETIENLSFVFRSSDGGTTGRAVGGADIYAPVYEPGIAAVLISPSVSSQYGDPRRSPVFASADDTVLVSAKAGGTEVSTMALYLDGSLVAQSSTDSIGYEFFTAGQPAGFRSFRLIATAVNLTADTVDFDVKINTEPTDAVPPSGIKPGINYINNSTVTLALFAPEKEFVYLIGDFNDWLVDDAFYMNRYAPSPDSTLWWITLDNLVAGQEYAFQYLIDGSIRIADPYTEKVLDPWNDSFIPSVTYPNLKPYPAGKTGEPVSVIQTAQPEFNWVYSDTFQRPPQDELVIYELLLRDFIERHDYETLIDTLDYLQHLGINAIELMPFNEFEGNSSWGYNPSFFFAPDKYYGTADALKTFIDECHRRGIAVLMDIVLNHAYGQSPMVRMYWNELLGRPAANNPWFNEVSPNQVFSFGYDFNHESVHTKNFIDRVNVFWLQEYRIDGYRFDFTKGFTNTPGDGGAYDPARIAILKRMADVIWDFDSTAVVILEHFAPNNEEKELAEYNQGMLIWGNLNYNYNEATMGYHDGGKSNFSWGYFGQRGWSKAHLVTYMESHDEERLMFKNLAFGNSSGGYSVKDFNTAINRNKMAAAFFLTIPGPKMIWQFGELGYDISIDDPCRVCEKPILWEYNTEINRKRLYRTYQALLKLRRENAVFRDPATTVTQDLASPVGGKVITLAHPEMNVSIVGNFGVFQLSVNGKFAHTGTWYDYFSGDSIVVTATNQNVSMQPGEFHIYTDVRIDPPDSDLLLGIDDELPGTAPLQFALAQNYPNPFNPTTAISYQLPSISDVNLKIYNTLGQLVKTLVSQKQSAGNYAVQWDGTNDLGERVASGIYIYRLQAGDFIQSRKMILMK
ncbi:MAG: alpha-amylase family glycosyl hydrolase [Calditrichia bacterium]